MKRCYNSPVSKVYPLWGWFFLLCSIPSFAQNLVPNGDLETFSTCPDNTDYYSDLATGWSFINNHGGTSDYFNTCATGSLHDDTNFAGDETPHSGNGYLGMTVHDAFNQREYAMVQLSSPLVAGEEYNVSAYVSAGTKDFSSVLYCNNIGIYLSATQPTVSGCGMCVGVFNVTPQVNETSIITTANGWQLISNTITAVGGEQWLVVGNFFNNAATSTQLTGNTCMGGCSTAYYYFDDVVVELVDNVLPVELSKFEGHCEAKEVLLNWTTASETNNSHFELQRINNSASSTTWEKLFTITGKGNSLIEQHYNAIDNAPQAGINYYRLRQVDFDGTESYSKIIAIDYSDCYQNDVNDQIFPNPANQVVQVISSVPPTQLNLYDNIGQQINCLIEYRGNISTINTADLPEGVYLLQIIRAKAVKTRKLIIQHSK